MVSAGSYDSDAFLVPGRSLSYFQLKICQALLSVLFCAYYLLRELARAGVDPLQEDVRLDTRFTQVKTFKWIIGKKNLYVPGHPSKTNAACKSTVGGSIIASLSRVQFTEGKFLMSMSLHGRYVLARIHLAKQLGSSSGYEALPQSDEAPPVYAPGENSRLIKPNTTVSILKISFPIVQG